VIIAGQEIGVAQVNRVAPENGVAPVNGVAQVVRVTLLVRLASLVAAVAGLVGQQLTMRTFLAIVGLAGTSFVALARQHLLDLVVRHPILAMADLLVVTSVFVMLGVDSPLAITALSTAFVTGLLFPMRVSLLLGSVLAVAYAAAAVQQSQGDPQPQFLLRIGMPVTFFCLVWIGAAVVQVYQAQVRAEAALADVLRAGAAAEERARLAREMHDSVAKSLQGLAMGAAALESRVSAAAAPAGQADPLLPAQARSLADGASRAAEEARGLLTRMRTDQPLHALGEVVTQVTSAWADLHDHPLSLDVADLPDPTPAVRYELLAALREALENVHRHAPGAAVAVLLRPSASGGEVVVVDQGPGFDPATVPMAEDQGHFGLRGMRERMSLTGGTALVESHPGQGTMVTLRFPVREGG
jgi:signal transduction histidine kinase